MTPFFSVIIPIYNIEKYVEACLDSVLRQEENDYEIIAVIDGSTDSSYEICKAKAEQFPQIRLVVQVNQGLSEARNQGILHANGQYLVFLDGDDMLAEHALQECRHALEQNNYPDVLVNRARYMDLLGKQLEDSLDFPENINELDNVEQFKICFIEGKFKPWAWVNIYKRTYIVDNHMTFKKGLLHEDELWTPQVFLHCQNIVFSRGILVQYRLARGESISTHITMKNIKAKLKIIDLLQTLYPEDEKKKVLLQRRAGMIYWGVLNDIARYRLEYTEIKHELKQKKYFLRLSKKHRILYYGVLVLGIDNTIRLLKIVRS